jgi:diguanylate cyclase (GGDEF)-like protein/PAS domain S-box-containing protein
MKIHLTVATLITVSMVAIVTFLYVKTYEEQKEYLEQKALLSLSEEKSILYNRLVHLHNDLIHIATHDIFDTEWTYNKKNVTNLLHFMSLNKRYDQLRYLDATAKERFRIIQADPPILQSQDTLQNKSKRDYVLEGFKLKAGEIYISSWDLNQEHGEIEVPYKPTFRLILADFDTQGLFHGLWIINYLGQELIDEFSNVQHRQCHTKSHLKEECAQLFIANKAGEWIMAPKGEKSFLFMFKDVGNQLEAHNEALYKAVESKEQGSVETADALYLFQNFYPIEMLRSISKDYNSQLASYSANQRSQRWTLIVQISNQLIHQSTQHYFYKSLPYIFFFWLVLQLVSVMLVELYLRNLFHRHELLLTVNAFSKSMDGIIITDQEGVIQKVNARYLELSGYQEHELLGKKSNVLSSGWTDSSRYEALWKELKQADYWEGELFDRHKNGSLIVLWLRIIGLADPNTKQNLYMGIATDITEKKEQEKTIHTLAFRDALTKLPNRNLFYDRLDKEIDQRDASGHGLAILFIDLDNFKYINDTAGHLLGDKFLIEISKRFQTVVRSEDTLARLGGDEFVVLLKSNSVDEIISLARRLIESISGLINIETFEFVTSASIGISLYPNDGEDTNTLIKHADTAMYEAKNSGKNTIRFFMAEMNQNISRRYMLETHLATALQKSELELYYQPQVDSRSNKVVGAEALLRWIHPELGFISPAEFIPIAESSKMIVPITEWIYKQVGQDLKNYFTTIDPAFKVAINISSVHLQKNNFISQLQNICDAYEINPLNIELEITEGALINDIKGAVQKLKQLKALGFKISIDDFGTGYSSLSYLKQFNFDKLKIDQSFVKNLPHDENDVGIVRAIIAITKALNMNVIAEGAENQEVVDFLAKEGCVLIQGYFYSKPLPLEAFKIYRATDAS